MKFVRRSLATLYLFLFCLSIASAQQESPAVTQSPVPIVTATASSEAVDYISVGRVHQTRLQVFSPEGSQVFDSDFQLGNLIAWRLTDSQGARLADGTYLYLVTVKEFSDHLTQKYGTAILERGGVYLEQPGRPELPSSQAAALEANRQSETISAVDRVGVIAINHAAIASGDGTPAGTAEPSGTGKVSSANPTGTQNATGAGSQNYLAKWTDSSGALGDSSLYETAAGRIGLGTTNPGARLHVVGVPGVTGASTFQLDAAVQFSNWTGVYPAFEVLNTNQTNNNVSLFQFSDAPSGASHAGIGAVNTNHASKFGDLFFYTKGTDGYQVRMGVFNGNVGIGTTTPQAKLVVAPGGSGGMISFSTPNSETGISIAGNGSNSRADVRFDGSTLKLVAVGSGLVPPSTNGIAIHTTGKVGIGTDTPNAGKLQVMSADSSVPAIYAESANRAVWGKSTGGSRGIFGESVSGEGVHGESVSGTGVAGFTQSGGTTFPGVYGSAAGSGGVGVLGEANNGNALGVYGKSTSTSNTSIGVYGGSTNGMGLRGDSTGSLGYGVFGMNQSGGMALGVNGDAAQSLNNGGLVKAMIVVGKDGTILRCYNSQRIGNVPFVGTPLASTNPCGFSVDHTDTGFYLVKFGFNVEQRFLSLTVYSNLRSHGNIFNKDVCPECTFTPDEVEVLIAESPLDEIDAIFSIIVY